MSDDNTTEKTYTHGYINLALYLPPEVDEQLRAEFKETDLYNPRKSSSTFRSNSPYAEYVLRVLQDYVDDSDD